MLTMKLALEFEKMTIEVFTRPPVSSSDHWLEMLEIDLLSLMIWSTLNDLAGLCLRQWLHLSHKPIVERRARH